MAKFPERASVLGPAFIRLLARLTDVDVPQSNHAVSERLSQWIDWTRAVALSKSLDGRLPEATADMPVFNHAEENECARLRASLIKAIADDQALARAKHKPAVMEESGANAPLDYSAFRQRYVDMQRKMLTATGHLRGRLRDMLTQTSPDMARLAEVDAAMELALSPREQTLLSAVPSLLGEHFERLQTSEHNALAEAQVAGHTATPSPGTWLRVFRKDMQGALLAELDVRFQPIEGLLAALRPR